jgi:hypothetical protein
VRREYRLAARERPVRPARLAEIEDIPWRDLEEIRLVLLSHEI